MNVEDVQDKLNDLQALQLTVWAESRSLSLASQIGVACCIRNRVLKQFRGTDYRTVCFSRLQFSGWTRVGGGANFEALMASCQQVLVLPEVRWPVQLKLAKSIADGIISGEIEDNTRGATHYYHKSIPAPSWTLPPAELTRELGGHRFYRNVR
jgi:N-acetylmuramoyl-L-alanine amidase